MRQDLNCLPLLLTQQKDKEMFNQLHHHHHSGTQAS